MELSDITHRIIGCAMRVHTTLGSGFPEVFYQRALEIELGKDGLKFFREYEMPVYYDGMQIGTRRVDFLIEERISVEIKATLRLEDIHLAQAKNYLEAYGLRTGLLLNFGSRSLEYKRIFNNRLPPSHSNPS
jgi:GxxExxY protein